MSSLQRRVQKELTDVANKPTSGISIGMRGDDITKLCATLIGPKDTPYENAVYNVSIDLPSNYPFSPPRVTFVTPIYHSNIDLRGNICLDILKDNWSPALTLEKMMLSLSSLLSDPNPNDPLNHEAAQLLRSNKTEHDRIAREFTLKHATNK